MAPHATAPPVHGLIRPTVADLHTSVTRASDGDPHLWSRLCHAADVPADADGPVALAALITAALEITAGSVRVAVTSLNVRVRAHGALAALGG
ncbi:hypothetical protein Q0Z83_043710 [Actinoplanes sichuanensis]|uniref:Uncharacterized protein n=1 Tax=Actinoplanes sichuanensis TaxID=512349 RepID=A0ABW4ATZ3_9ACTN|nr:hypothetical protein [Actinoplanes sichuanensis]BEL06180.1 hypothetical protein Q0Z83_043710 [Actinoplanes sichuanensis]